MTDPLDAVRARKEALAAASWSPLGAVDGVETAQVMGSVVARNAEAPGLVLWFGPEEWDHFEGGDQDILATLRALVA